MFLHEMDGELGTCEGLWSRDTMWDPDTYGQYPPAPGPVRQWDSESEDTSQWTHINTSYDNSRASELKFVADLMIGGDNLWQLDTN